MERIANQWSAVRHNSAYRQEVCWLLLMRRGISPQLHLTVLNIRHQIPQEHPHPGRLFWVPRCVESKHRETSADLIQRQQSTLKDFCGECRGGERGHRSGGDCSQCSHKHPPRTTQQAEAQRLRCYLTAGAVQCSQRLMDAT